MQTHNQIVLATFLLMISQLARASSDVSGDIHRYTSTNGVQEQCVILDRMPGAVYSANDSRMEQAFCKINLYDKLTAVCPKTWSTSPGMEVFQLPVKAGTASEFERRVCGTSLHKEISAAGQPVTFKTTMNGRATSGTFSTASLLYYHFSRFLHATIHIPVSVYRSIDKDVYRQRVVRRGLALTAGSKAQRMNHEAWLVMQKAVNTPASYHPIDELFSRDRKSIYGIFIQPVGSRYNTEINGTRQSGWGEGQNRDFQETAPFLALRSEQPLPAAIKHGLARAKKNTRLRHDMGNNISAVQMVYWMQELTEISILDYIFSQQDRVGNVDYRRYWYWVADGRVQHRHANGRKPPADIAAYRPVRLMRSQLNDNDAGGRLPYVNYAKKTGMLEKIRHYNPVTYRQLLALEQDFRQQGKLYKYVKKTFGLSADQLQQIVKNTLHAAITLKTNCKQGKLRFDLEPDAYFLHGKSPQQHVDCGR